MKITQASDKGYGNQDIYIDEFDFSKFKEVYDKDVDDIRWYIEKCTENNDIRRNKWAGKSSDLKKHSEDAFPYQYASDTEVFTCDRSIQNGVALIMNGMNRSQIRAYPREASDVSRAAEVSIMLKWMRDAGIESFQREMELAASFWLEKGLAITYCGWKKKNRSVTKTYDIDQVMKSIPELPELQAMEEQEFAEFMMDEDRVDEALEFFNEVEGWTVNEARLKKALKQLRKDGVADIPIIIEDEGSFDVRTLPPDADVILPAYVMNVQDSPRVHMRMLLTGQDLINYRETMDWDADWVEYMVKNHTGMSKSEFNTPHGTLGYDRYGSSRNQGSRNGSQARDFIEVVFTYERLIDEEDGAEGIYLTVWSPRMEGDIPDVQSFAYRKLQSGRKNYPFVVTPLTYEAKTLYESTSWPEILKAPQKTQKTLRDNYIDEAQWSASPMMWGGPGVDLSQVGPGARMNGPANREPKFINKQQDFNPNIKLDEVIESEAMQHIGQSAGDPLSEARQRHCVDSFLRRHVQRVLAMAYDTYKLEGPKELYFRITGKPEGTTFIKNEGEAEMDLSVSFNATYDDPEQLERLINVVDKAKQLSPSRVGSDEVADWFLNAADPMLGEMVLKPEEEGSARITDETLDDIQRMSAGIGTGAREDAAEARIQVVQQWQQQQMEYEQAGIPTLYTQSQQYQMLVEQYVKQLQQTVDQQVNGEEYGKLGARAAKVGNIETQGIQDAG
jgi:hypothetical protein